MNTTTGLRHSTETNKHDATKCLVCQVFATRAKRDDIAYKIEKLKENLKNAATVAAPTSPEEPAKPETPKIQEVRTRHTQETKRRRMREATTRIMARLEKELTVIPDSAAGIAGYLQALGFKGGQTDSDNALASYLARQCAIGDYNSEMIRDVGDVRLNVGEEYITVDSDLFQMCAIPPSSVTLFVRGVRMGRFPEIFQV